MEEMKTLTLNGVTYAPRDTNLAEHTPYGGRDNFMSNILHIDLTNKDSYVNQAGVIAVEDASTLVNSPITSGAFYAYREVLFSDNPTGGLPKCIVRLTQAYPHHGTIMTNIYDPNYGYWIGWEWFNPPLQLGVEYRTTERYNGKPVYTKLIDFGNLPNSSSKNVATAVPADKIISFDGIVTNGSGTRYQFPIVGSSGTAFARSYIVSGSGSIGVTTTTDASGYTAQFVVKYTKD